MDRNAFYFKLLTGNALLSRLTTLQKEMYQFFDRHNLTTYAYAEISRITQHVLKVRSVVNALLRSLSLEQRH
eukprot:8034800-Pyramimonas_sp.AAC.1